MKKHPHRVVHVHDDMFGYMQDSLKWVETYNPVNNESELGFNYYGYSIIGKSGAATFLKVMEAWLLLFSQAPDEIKLTGWYTWTDDENPKQSGYYDKLSFSKIEVLNTLRKLIEFAIQVEAGDYKLIYNGI
ncbi:hypothetical protein [Paenibacillus sp. BIHB 4019]|nr:hypothetical protein [Paenibacillus sp. BIHB 4019]